MIIPCSAEQSVQLKIIDLESPEITFKSPNNIWLMMQLKVNSKIGKWEVNDAFLTTTEIRCIIDWFKKLSSRQEPKYRFLTFIEPNISFKLLNEPTEEIKAIRIKFDLECRQKKATNQKEYFVDMFANDAELFAVKEGLEAELEALAKKMNIFF